MFYCTWMCSNKTFSKEFRYPWIKCRVEWQGFLIGSSQRLHVTSRTEALMGPRVRGQSSSSSWAAMGHTAELLLDTRISSTQMYDRVKVCIYINIWLYIYIRENSSGKKETSRCNPSVTIGRLIRTIQFYTDKDWIY